MDSAPVTTELDLLSEDELTEVVGGSVRGFDAREFVLSKVGMCGCGLAH